MASLAEEVNKSWKPTKIRKKVKLPKLYKILKPSKIFKIFKPLFKMLSPRSKEPKQPLLPEEQPFMACRIKVDASKPGWHKTLLRVVKNCKLEARFQMNGDGVVEVSGIGDPDKLLKKLGKAKGIEIGWFQYGECSNKLFMPPVKQKSNANNNNNNNTVAPNPGVNGYPNYQTQSYSGYGYPNYQPQSYSGYGYPTYRPQSNSGYGYLNYQPRRQIFGPY